MSLEGSQICGLVGVAGYISVKEENVFKRLLEIDTIRGPHSTGVLAVNSAGATEVVKAVGTPWSLYELKAFDNVMRGSLLVLMGHNRWATKGKISRRNAHPFEHDHIIGAHNGTLRSQQLLPDYQNFDVDSDNIFHAMAKIGVDDTIKKTCGAFALTWYDSAQQTMNFVRNDERPLFLAESEDKRTVFWASERWMLDVTLTLADIKYREPFEPKVGQLFTYPIELTYSPKAFAEVKVRPLELHKWPTFNRETSNVRPFEKAKEVEGNVVPKKFGPEYLIRQEKLEFFVASLKTSPSGQQYVSCLPTMDDCDVELRLYTSDTGLIQLMINSCNLFTGKVRGYTTYGGDSYCTLDPRFIEETESPVDDPDFAIGFEDELLTEEEYNLATSCGCGVCKVVPSIEESDELTWVSKISFICGDCKDMPIVQDFINETKADKASIKH